MHGAAGRLDPVRKCAVIQGRVAIDQAHKHNMRVAAHMSLGGTAISPDTLGTMLHDIIEDAESRNISMDHIQKVVAEDVGQELKRFEDAAHGVREDVDRMLEAHDMQSGEQREILETFRMFIDDRGWLERYKNDRGIEQIAKNLRVPFPMPPRFGGARVSLRYGRWRVSQPRGARSRILVTTTFSSSLPNNGAVGRRRERY